jgi:hypothetical protein
MGWVELLKTHSITHTSLGYCGLVWVQPTPFRRVIEITSSIDYIKLKTSLEVVNFYIVLIDISFLLSLIDMNKLKVYFHNFINELVQMFASLIRAFAIIRK